MTTTTSLAENRKKGSGPLALLLTLALALLLCACGQADPVCGRYLCVGARGDGLNVPAAAFLGEDPAVLSLTADGRGSLRLGDRESSLSWTREGDSLSVSLGGEVYEAALENGQILLTLEPTLRLRFAPEEQAAAPETVRTLDWYGWWSTENSQGLMPDSWRDCCARLEESGFGPVLTVWDEDSSYEQPLGVLYLRWEDGLAVPESGWLLSSRQVEGLWRLDPAAQIWELSGSIRGESESYDFHFRLRPWGASWPEEEERIPFRYTDWYLPLIEAGASMPGQIGS